jgi:UDP-glucose 4-epimerase
VVDAYVEAGHSVTVLDNLSRGKKIFVSPRARFVRADVRSPRLKVLFERGRFDVVNHHAAQIDVRRSVADPQEDADINVVGLLNILENARRTKVKKMIFSASGGTYYGECGRPARESDPPRPLSPYGVSKLAGEFYLRAFGSLFGLDYTVFRYANVFGPRQDPHGEAGVVAIFCQRVRSGDPAFIYGDGKQERDYVFVKDVAQANLLALRKGSQGVFNIGTGKATSVLDLFRAINLLGGGLGKKIHRPARPGELCRSVLNVSLAKKNLGWAPRGTLREGLADTYQSLAYGGRSSLP